MAGGHAVTKIDFSGSFHKFSILVFVFCSMLRSTTKAACIICLLICLFVPAYPFLQPSTRPNLANSALSPAPPRSSSSSLYLLDPVSYARTEFVSTALVTNQIPRTADVALQVGMIDPRAAYYVPKVRPSEERQRRAANTSITTVIQLH